MRTTERGQMTIEMMLLLVVILGVGLAISKSARERGFMKDLVEGPWLVVQGMIEDGVWIRAPASKQRHPHDRGRHSTYDAGGDQG